MELDQDLSLLICSANIGNAEPTPESFASWIPEDGNILPTDNSNNSKYHLIVVGMQEAAFTSKTRLTKKASNASSSPDIAQSVRSVATEEGGKKKGKLQRKAEKVQLILRGLTAQQTHRAPQMRSKSFLLRQASSDDVQSTGLISSSQYDTTKFASLFAERCPSYSLVACNMRGEMRLWVLCLKELKDEIGEVHVAGENTGIGSIMANKGGIIATLTLRSTRLSFLTCHLEAHEGTTHYTNRNKNLIEIFGGAKAHPDYYMMDATIYSHHMFICGDLNYRLRLNSNDENNSSSKNLKNSNKEDNEPDNGSGYSQAMKLIGEQKWRELYAGDELCMALENKECLVGFETLPCDFSPTFKVAREEGYVYNEKRTPSYTDRILWKSTEGMKEAVTPNTYEPCPDFITSDHKPIRGSFTVKLNKSAPARPSTPKDNKSNKLIHFLISNIKCTNLPIMDSEIMGGLSDPYILFVSSPKNLTWKKAWPSTKTIFRNLNPVWDEETHLTLKHESYIESLDDLSGDMIYMVVMDYDQTSGDDFIGSVALNVQDLCANLKLSEENREQTTKFTDELNLQQTNISRPVVRNGQEYGMLECTVISAYLEPSEVTSFLRTAAKSRNMKFRDAKNKFFGLFR